MKRGIHALALAAALAGTLPAEAADRPNFVFILVDDMPWYGTPIAMDEEVPYSSMRFRQMPQLERFAAESMRFSRAYAPAPICGPSRAAYQTGMSGARSGVTMNGGALRSERDEEGGPLMDGRKSRRYLPHRVPVSVGGVMEEDLTIAEALRPLGYATAHIGKWHCHGGGPGLHGYDLHDGETENAEGSPGEEGNPKRITGITDRSIAFMKEQVGAGKPFFVQLSHYANHARAEFNAESLARFANDPVIATAEQPSQRKNAEQWCAMSWDLDVSIGRVLDTLKQLGIEEETWVVVTSDNGHSRWNEGQVPLKGDKWTLWECGLRIPMWIRGPGVAGGSVSDALVCGIDLFPTWLELAGGNPAEQEQLDGGSLLPLLHAKGEVSRRDDHLVFHYPHYRNGQPMSSIYRGDYKLIHFYDRPAQAELYHLDADPSEATNLSLADPARVARLQRRLLKTLESREARMPVVNPEFDPTKVQDTHDGKKSKETPLP